MRHLSHSEKKLLGLLLTAIFLAANLAGVRIWLDLMTKQNQAISQAKAAIEEGKSWILAAETLSDKLTTLPPLPQLNESQASSSLLREVRSSAASHGLNILEESRPPPPPDLPEKAVSLRLKITGEFASFVRFLFDIQHPTAWRSINTITTKADASPQNVLAELEIRQYFKQTDAPNP